MAEASPWVQRFARLIRPAGTVLDLACGSGRHVRWLHAQGFSVTGVDRDAETVAPLSELAEVVVADVENGPWPLAGRRFDAVLVTNYLWRPLLPTIFASLAEGGVLIYETFADGQQSVGRPSRPDFLLRRGELWAAASGLRIVAYEDGFLDDPARFVQRIVAVAERSAGGAAARYALDGPAAPAG